MLIILCLLDSLKVHVLTLPVLVFETSNPTPRRPQYPYEDYWREDPPLSYRPYSTS